MSNLSKSDYSGSPSNSVIVGYVYITRIPQALFLFINFLSNDGVSSSHRQNTLFDVNKFSTITIWSAKDNAEVLCSRCRFYSYRVLYIPIVVAGRNSSVLTSYSSCTQDWSNSEKVKWNSLTLTASASKKGATKILFVSWKMAPLVIFCLVQCNWGSGLSESLTMLTIVHRHVPVRDKNPNFLYYSDVQSLSKSFVFINTNGLGT